MHNKFICKEIKARSISAGKINADGSIQLYAGSGAIEKFLLDDDSIKNVGVTNYCDYIIVLADSNIYEVTGDNIKKIGE